MKKWWNNYLTSEDRLTIGNVVDSQGNIDMFNILIYSILKHFIGIPNLLHERSPKILMNFTYPKLHDFRWYKDMFMTKVLIRENCNKSFCKE